MNTAGIYEQLITQLVEQNLDRESFHVGERLWKILRRKYCHR
ncbi:hypothetical protein CPS_3440 [Colwellia psychrerythraea 34H]|uniref:Uncharacterized protein n=1 Tax=Colwellia psychrerythraea (strain 34H / ATCC BAA-681) TaxID=167879 RepID=Q47YK5_COLP3|nr:hypothetical protein CPS_3440 [Colwellia psychrerythraea 34H]